MKKVQVVLAIVAFSIAGAAVYAGNVNTFKYWKHTQDAAQCSGTEVTQTSIEDSPLLCAFTGNKCSVVQVVGGENVTFYFSRQELNGSTQVDCKQYLKN